MAVENNTGGYGLKVGFIILNYNSSKLTMKLASKVSSMKLIDEVLVVDNMSTDDSFKKLKNISSKKIQVVSSKRNGGYSYGNNFGASICYKDAVDIIFISNPDVDINEVSINEMLLQFEETDYSILTAVEYDIHGNMSSPPIWKMNSYLDDIADCFFLGRSVQRNKKGESVNTSIGVQPLNMIKGSFFGVRLKDFIEVGGFDEDFFLFCEERVITEKFRQNNKKIGLVTNAVYYHNHSASINKAYKQKMSQMKLLYDSRILYYSKYTDLGCLRTSLLKFCMKISLVEFRIWDKLHDFRRNINGIL